MERKHVERFLEFLTIGVFMGVIEDLIAISLVTNEPVNPKMIIVVLLVAIPFAAFSELIVDHEDFEVTETMMDWLGIKGE